MEGEKKGAAPAVDTGSSSDLNEFHEALVASAVAIADDDPRTNHLPMATAVATAAAAAPEAAAAARSSHNDNLTAARAYEEVDDAVAKKLAAEDQTEETTASAEAVAVPGAYTTPDTDAADRRAARTGTLRGQQQAQREVQELLRHNRDIPVRNFAEQQRIVESATPRGLVQNYKEETGLTQTSATVPKDPPYVAKPPAREPEFFAGTYGKEYQMGEYQTKEYETSEYETTPYKSVYES